MRRIVEALREEPWRLMLVVAVSVLSVCLAAKYSFRDMPSTVAATLFGLSSAFFWFIAALVNVLVVPPPQTNKLSNADIANAAAAVHAACFVVVGLSNSALKEIWTAVFEIF